jgi:hypothetical protein
MPSIDVAATIAGLGAVGNMINETTGKAVGDVAHLFEARISIEAPVGTPGNSTNAPGDLGRSVIVTGPIGGDGVYEADVGPTMIYSRQRELGGRIYAKNPSGLLTYVKFGHLYRKPSVYQVGQYYTKRAYDFSETAVETIVIEDFALALAGVYS